MSDFIIKNKSRGESKLINEPGINEYEKFGIEPIIKEEVLPKFSPANLTGFSKETSWLPEKNIKQKMNKDEINKSENIPRKTLANVNEGEYCIATVDGTVYHISSSLEEIEEIVEKLLLNNIANIKDVYVFKRLIIKAGVTLK